MMLLDVQLTAIIIGFFVGLLVALTGAGGGILAIPLLLYLLDLTLVQAAPIALLAVFFASGIGAIQGYNKGTVRYRTAALIALFGIILAPLGVYFSQYLSAKTLHIIFSAVLFFVAISVWRQAKKANAPHLDAAKPVCAVNPATSSLFWTMPCTLRLIATGSITGILAGLLGVGGGFIIVPSFTKLTNFNAQTIVATTLAAVTLISASSVFSYMYQQNIVWKIAIPFVLSTTLAMWLLSRWREKIPNAITQKSFASLCVLAALYLMVKEFII